MNTSGFIAAVAAVFVVFTVPSVRADADASAADSGADEGLQQIVISATRTAQPLDKTGSSISVLNAQDLNLRQSVIVSDALAPLPGVTVARNGGVGQSSSIYIRGAEAGQSLLLVDGIRINDPSAPDGEAVLGDLLVNNIDRIEVLRGPQSTLYGSEAMGGVINIVTQRGAAAPLSARLSAEGGSYDTSHLNAAFNGSDGGLDYGSAVNYFDSRGISAADARNGNTEPDGYRNLGATVNVRAHLSEAISLDLRGFYQHSRTDIDGYPPPDYTFQDTPEFAENWLRAGYAALDGSWFDGSVRQRLAIIGSDSNRRFFGQFNPLATDPDRYAFSPAENFYAEGGATRLEYQGVQEIGSANELTYGAERELTTIATDSLPDEFGSATGGRDRISGYYAQWQSTLAQQLTLAGGARYDHDQQFHGHTSVKLAGAWQLAGGSTVLRANYGGGFKAPTLYQLFSPYSNPDSTLRPETSDGWELGFDQLLLQKALRLSLTYFRRGEHDMIDFFDCPFGAAAVGACAARADVGGYYYNVGRSFAHGFEAEVLAHPQPGVSVWGNYTNLIATDDLTGLALARRAHVSANLGASLSAGSSTLGATLGYVGARFDDAGNTVPLPSAQTINIFASYALSPQLQLLLRVENLTDELKQPVFGYGAMGRAVYGGVRVTL